MPDTITVVEGLVGQNRAFGHVFIAFGNKALENYFLGGIVLLRQWIARNLLASNASLLWVGFSKKE